MGLIIQHAPELKDYAQKLSKPFSQHSSVTTTILRVPLEMSTLQTIPIPHPETKASHICNSWCDVPRDFSTILLTMSQQRIANREQEMLVIDLEDISEV